MPRVRISGQARLRAHDGDHELFRVEQRAPRRGREADARAVEEVLAGGPASTADLATTGMTRRQVDHPPAPPGA